MRLSKFFGLEPYTPKDTHDFAMRRTGGDKRWLEAMDALGKSAEEKARQAGVQEGSLAELYPTESTVIVPDITAEDPSFKHVRILAESVIFDQDSDVS